MKKAPDKQKLQYCAFLRGINVGGHSVIKMEELRKSFEELGFTNVKTVLASGNVVFDSPQDDVASISRSIAGKLQEITGREVLAIVRSADELRELAARQPFKDVDQGTNVRCMVTLVTKNQVPRGSSGKQIGGGLEILSVSDGIICSVVHYSPGVGTPELMSVIEKVYGKNVTTRTWDTIAKVLKAAGN